MEYYEAIKRNELDICSHAPHHVSVNKRLHIQRWSHNIISPSDAVAVSVSVRTFHVCIEMKCPSDAFFRIYFHC